MEHVSSLKEGSQRTNNFCKNHHFPWPSYHEKGRKGKKGIQNDSVMLGRCSQRLQPDLSTDQVRLGALSAVAAIPPHTWAGSPLARIHQHSNIWYKTHRSRITFSQQNLTSQANADTCKTQLHTGKLLTICPSSARKCQMATLLLTTPEGEEGGSCGQVVPFN